MSKGAGAPKSGGAAGGAMRIAKPTWHPMQGWFAEGPYCTQLCFWRLPDPTATPSRSGTRHAKVAVPKKKAAMKAVAIPKKKAAMKTTKVAMKAAKKA